MLSPRGIALQGVGQPARWIALQGLLGMTSVSSQSPDVSSGGSGPGAQISMSEWLRKYGSPQTRLPVAVPVGTSRRRKKRIDEELLLLAALKAGRGH